MKNMTFDNFNASIVEGKLLLSAISILTQSNFLYYGKIIDGSKQTPHQVFDMIVKLALDIENYDEA
jgi:hypothetical protein